MEQDDAVLLCNGEIYNCDKLAKEFGIRRTSGSDCEVLLPLFRRFGFEDMLRLLVGEFAILIYDRRHDIIYAGRDYLGMRPLYIGCNDNTIVFASTLQGIPVDFCKVAQFPPRHAWSSVTHKYTLYTELPVSRIPSSLTQTCTPDMTALLYDTLYNSVRIRIGMADVPVGVCLSGGLDSSAIAAMAVAVVKQAGHSSRTLHTFSIGMPGSPDLKAAAEVAAFLGTSHHEIVVTKERMLARLPHVPGRIGSCDVTTVRASTPHSLLADEIAKTGVKVVLSGELADEQSGSYGYFALAPNNDEFHQERIRLLSDVHHFDGLRADRCIASAGLEVRFPFGDPTWCRLYMSLAVSEFRFGQDSIEKRPLRRLLKGMLPESVLNRRKNGFSDGCSERKESWHDIIKQEHPKELEYYMDRLRAAAPNHVGVTPYQWLPRWCDTKDPSARELSVYASD